MTGRGPQRVHGGHRLGPWAPAQGITVLVSHIPGHVHTTHASTHPILLSGQRLARSHTHSPSLPHTWSQSKSESYCCAGGWGVRGGYSTKSENSTITTMPMQSRSTCCRECLWGEGQGSGGHRGQKLLPARAPKGPARSSPSGSLTTGHLPPRGRAARLPGRCRESHQR